MAWTVLFALIGSLIFSLTLMPVLATVALPRKMNEREVWLIRGVKWLYVPILERMLRHRVWTVLAASAVFVASIPVALHLEREFMPRLEEGDLLIETVRLPTATLEGAEEMTTEIEKQLLKFAEVRTVFCKTGRPEIASDVMGVHQTDVWVMLKPESEWPRHKTRDELSAEMMQALEENISGAIFGLLGQSQKSFRTESQLLSAFQEARLGLDQIVNDANSTGYPPLNHFAVTPLANQYAIGPVGWQPGYVAGIPCTI
jgi:cobalt-zinc-cadmium resistance protein CzcA